MHKTLKRGFRPSTAGKIASIANVEYSFLDFCRIFLSSAVGDDRGIAMSFFFFGPRVVIENGRDTPDTPHPEKLHFCSPAQALVIERNGRERDFFCAPLLMGGNKKFGDNHDIVI